MLNEIMLIILLLAGIFSWFRWQQVNEIALNAAKTHCLAAEVQMLDDYVAAKSVRLARDKFGNWRLRRTFEFEFTATGNERYNGKITVLGRQVESVYMEPYRIETSFTLPINCL